MPVEEEDAAAAAPAGAGAPAPAGEAAVEAAVAEDAEGLVWVSLESRDGVRRCRSSVPLRGAV